MVFEGIVGVSAYSDAAFDDVTLDKSSSCTCKSYYVFYAAKAWGMHL
jgi:hypothetical protein